MHSGTVPQLELQAARFCGLVLLIVLLELLPHLIQRSLGRGYCRSQARYLLFVLLRLHFVLLRLHFGVHS
jgi:hypothetical protein